MTDKLTNPVGFLQEYCQRAKTAAFPRYIELGSSGPDHSREFSCRCIFDGFEVIGKGNQKKQAKSEAAKTMINYLDSQNYFDKSSLNEITSNTNLCNSQQDPSLHRSAVVTFKNPISALQEHCQKKLSNLPSYFESASAGGFVCECSVDDIKSFGEGTSKKIAKTEAAMKMCVKLNIVFTGEDNLEKDQKEIEPIYSEKNAISALQELCSQNGNLAAPVYENKPSFFNQFVVACNVGSISAEGTDTTKKGAKLSAANRVLGQIINQRAEIGSKVSVPSNVDNVSVKMELNSNSYTSHRPLQHHLLEDFPLQNDEESNEDVQNDYKVKSKHIDVFKKLQALTLDDSVVEVEPSTVILKKDPELVSLEHEIVQSLHKKNKYRSHGSSENHCDDDRGGIQQLKKKEDKLWLLNVSGDVVIHSSSTQSDSVIDDLQGQTVTLTGTVDKYNKRGPSTSLKLDVFSLETKRHNNDGPTQKTPTSETLLKWAQKDGQSCS